MYGNPQLYQGKKFKVKNEEYKNSSNFERGENLNVKNRK